METFTPTLDWGNELVASALWVARAWAIAAVGTLVVLALLARFTTWGRQFWRITGDYFKGRQSIPVWALLGVLLLSVMIDVRLGVLFSYQSNDQFSALQAAFEGEGAAKDAAKAGFWSAILILAGLVVTDIVRNVLDVYLMQRFIIRWRVWLTHRLTGDWLDGDAYYRGRFVDDPIDNPDQRIQQDIDIFTTGTGPETNTPTVGTAQTLMFGSGIRHWSLVAFTPILWGLAGPLTLFGVTLPKALFWMALVYVFFTTVVAFWIGHPLIRLSFRNELTNAAFRYALVRLRDAAEAVGLYRGEGAERGPADDPIHRRHRQLPGVRPPQHRIPRLEPVDEPDRRPAADGRPGSPGVRAVRSSRRRHSVVAERSGRVARLAGVLPRRLRRVRRLSRGHHPPRRVDHRQRNRQGSYRH